MLGKGYLTQREFALKELREESLGFPMGVALSAGPACPAGGCPHHCPWRLRASSAKQPLPNLPLCPGSRQAAPQLFSTPILCIFSRLRTEGSQSLLPRAQSFDGFDLLSLSQTKTLQSPCHLLSHPSHPPLLSSAPQGSGWSRVCWDPGKRTRAFTPSSRPGSPQKDQKPH